MRRAAPLALAAAALVLAGGAPALALTPDGAVDLARSALEVALTVAGPVVLAGLCVGVLMGVVQTMTSVQDATLTFVPKFLVVFGTVFLLLPWLLGQILDFTRHLLETLPTVVS